MSSLKTAGEHLSSNPALAAIQRAKSSTPRKSAEHDKHPPALGTSPPVGGPLASTLNTHKSLEMPNVSFLKENKDANVFGVNDGSVEKGWWATTDAGIMNIAQEAEKPHTASSYVQDSAVAHCSNKRLDYSAMFNNNMSDVGSREGAQ